MSAMEERDKAAPDTMATGSGSSDSSASSAAPASPALPAPSVRVLLVDDQLLVAEALRRMLAGEHDLACRFVTSPDKALDMAHAWKPTVILQDLVMPQMDGFELLQAYRADPAMANLPVVVLSTNEDPAQKARAFAAGANDYLVKWPDRIELLARVRHLSQAYLHRSERDAAFAALRESEARLANANAELRSLSRLKDEFVSTVSHELRTPLTSIRASLALLADGMEGEISGEAKELVSIANNSCERLVRMISDLLDIEKIESGKMHFELTRQPLQPLLEQAIDATTGYADQFGVPLLLQGLQDTEEEIMVKVDRDRMTQVLVNLLSNAIKFSPVNVPVCLKVTRPPERICLSVIDRGPGIPADFRSRIFQKFAQADSSNTRRLGGSGLGLSISKRIVEQHGGEIGFRDWPGGGTEFYVELPA
jgi:signal transduction histidine kinase